MAAVAGAVQANGLIGKIVIFRENRRNGSKMAEIKIEQGHGIIYECPECGNEEIELGQNYCQICGEPLEWVEE